VSSPPPSPEDGNRYSFRNVVFSRIPEDGYSPQAQQFCVLHTIVRTVWNLRGLLFKGLLLTLKAFLEGGSSHIFIHLRGIITRFACLQKEFSIRETDWIWNCSNQTTSVLIGIPIPCEVFRYVISPYPPLGPCVTQGECQLTDWLLALTCNLSLVTSRLFATHSRLSWVWVLCYDRRSVGQSVLE
jgi:hypothetical protein